MSNQVDRHYYEVATPGSISEKLAAIARDKIYTDFLRFAGRAPPTGFSMSAFRTLLAMRPTSLSADIPPVQYHGSRLRTWRRVQGFLSARSNTVRLSPTMRCRSMTGHSTSLRRTRFLSTSAASKTSASSSLNYCALADCVFVTVPHRFFPIEHHTAIPFLHWFDSSFTLACRLFGKEKWASPENLILMSQQKLRDAYLARDGSRDRENRDHAWTMEFQPLPVCA